MYFNVKLVRVTAHVVFAVVVSFVWTLPAGAQCYDLTLPGPAMTSITIGHPDTGLVLMPLADISLKSFTFNNQGLADTVYLQRVSDGAVLYSTATSAGSPAHTVEVDWDLLYGETYRLLATDPNNGRYTTSPGFPYSNSNLTVQGTWAYNELNTTWWFHFTGLRTECSVCTPSEVSGPALTGTVGSWPDSGLSLTATANTTLRSFRFLNNGTHARILLIRESDEQVLYGVTTPDGESDYVVVVDWNLLAGETYHLVSEESSNGKYANFSSFPVVDGDLIVNGAWKGGVLDTSYWFKFTDLNTRCGPCPFDTIKGPGSFTNPVAGHAESGLSITANVDTILRRFTFNNQGALDTVRLVRESDSVTIGQVQTPAADTAYHAVVNWPMEAGQTYHLVSVAESNGRHRPLTGWPYSNTIVTVNGSWYDGGLSTGYWFTFTNLLMTSDCGLFEFDFEEADLFDWSRTSGADCGGWEWNGACWYTSAAVAMTCNQVCSTRGGFDVAGSTHTGNRVGIHYWPEKAFGFPDCMPIECSSIDNNTNWGATGVTPDGNWSHTKCYVNCACNN